MKILFYQIFHSHIQHDVKDQYYVDIDEKKTSQQELEFYNFKLHDYDNNLLLDGLELLMAMNHEHQEKEKDPNQVMYKLQMN